MSYSGRVVKEGEVIIKSPGDKRYRVRGVVVEEIYYKKQKKGLKSSLGQGPVYVQHGLKDLLGSVISAQEFANIYEVNELSYLKMSGRQYYNPYGLALDKAWA